MADLDVQRKGPSIWPWVLGLIVLALVIWALVVLFQDDSAVVTDSALERAGSVENRPEIGASAPDTAPPPGR